MRCLLVDTAHVIVIPHGLHVLDQASLQNVRTPDSPFRESLRAVLGRFVGVTLDEVSESWIVTIGILLSNQMGGRFAGLIDVHHVVVAVAVHRMSFQRVRYEKRMMAVRDEG